MADDRAVTPTGQVYPTYKLVISTHRTGIHNPCIAAFYSKPAAVTARDLYRKIGFVGEVVYDPGDGSSDPDGLNPGDIVT